MVISHKYKYLFIEVPSTASTAISAELREHYGGELILGKHANYSQFRCLLRSGELSGRGKYFTFATVRNPLDQAVSYYTRLRRNHHGQYTDTASFRRNGGWIPDEHLEHFEFVQRNDADPNFL